MSLAVEAVALTKRYGPVQAITGLDLQVRTGEVFGYLGPNGAGKTTTIRLLLALQKPTGGSARVLGFDCQRERLAVHRRTGYLPGELALFGRMNGRQHIEHFSRARGGRVPPLAWELAERLGAVLDQPVRQLSKGNRQKVGLVLAFMHRPELLVLDEPTSGLDPLVQAEFERLVRDAVAEGRTVFLSSHDLDEVQRLADRIAIVRNGRLVVLDTVEGFRQRAPKKVTASFPAPVDPSLFARLEGVSLRRGHGATLELDVTGPIGPVLAVIAEHNPLDVVSRHADLEELFLDLYRSPAQPAVPAPAHA